MKQPGIWYMIALRFYTDCKTLDCAKWSDNFADLAIFGDAGGQKTTTCHLALLAVGRQLA